MTQKPSDVIKTTGDSTSISGADQLGVAEKADLLRLAAKAINRPLDATGTLFSKNWDPLESDEDAFHLNFVLKGQISYHDCGVSVFIKGNTQGYFVDIVSDDCRSTRLAIVFAAAEYGSRIEN